MEKAKILIVEDEAIIAMELKSNLENLEYEVTSIVDTGTKAIEKVKTDKPDIILMDIRIKGEMDGIETTAQIQANLDIPIIFLSAFEDKDKLERAILTLPYGYLLKPVQNRDLKVNIEMALYAARINSERKQALEAVQKLNDELERKVSERTVEYKQAKEEAELANQAKSDFLAKITHELRNPLHHILSFAQFGIKKTGLISEDKVIGFFKTILTSGSSLLDLVNGLLDLSKLESGKTDYNMSSVSLRDIIYEIVNECSSFSAEKDISTLVIDSQDSTELVCDRKKIGQVIRNLLNNAISFTPSGGKITISLDSYQLPAGRKTGDLKTLPALCTTVKDEGIGIPKDELEHIFEKFIQSSFTKDESGGTGLGLSICQEIIKDHQGKIWAENNPEGGATFNFVLPYEPKLTDDI